MKEQTRSYCMKCQDTTFHIFKYNVKIRNVVIPRIVECVICGKQHAIAW